LLFALHQYLGSFLRYELEVRGEAQPAGREIELMERAFSRFRLEYSKGTAASTELVIALVKQIEMKAIVEEVVEYYTRRAAVTGEATGKVQSRKALGDLVKKLGKELPKFESVPQKASQVEEDLRELYGLLSQ
jgi:hypothetical protein